MAESASVRDVPAKEKAAAKSVRPRVPTSVVVTVLGAALTVWLGPAFTRQWEDRQTRAISRLGLPSMLWFRRSGRSTTGRDLRMAKVSTT
jgi:hypothetical protein